jgi:hypothetical protein
MGVRTTKTFRTVVMNWKWNLCFKVCISWSGYCKIWKIISLFFFLTYFCFLPHSAREGLRDNSMTWWCLHMHVLIYQTYADINSHTRHSVRTYFFLPFADDFCVPCYIGIYAQKETFLFSTSYIPIHHWTAVGNTIFNCLFYFWLRSLYLPPYRLCKGKYPPVHHAPCTRPPPLAMCTQTHPYAITFNGKRPSIGARRGIYMWYTCVKGRFYRNKWTAGPLTCTAAPGGSDSSFTHTWGCTNRNACTIPGATVGTLGGGGCTYVPSQVFFSLCTCMCVHTRATVRGDTW